MKGIPAFPTPATKEPGTIPGMTLRDYFAASASEADIQFYLQRWTTGAYAIEPACTRQAARFKHADDMMKEREK